MTGLDRRLGSLQEIEAPAPPSVAALERRNRRRVRRRVVAAGAVVVLAGVGVMAGTIVLDSGEPRTAVVAGDPPGPSPTSGNVGGLGPADPSRQATPTDVLGLDDLPRCPEPPELFLGELDPERALDVATDPAPPTRVLDRVPVDVRAAAAASCAHAVEGPGADLAAISLQDDEGRPLFQAASVPNGADTVPDHFPDLLPDATYQQVALGSGQPFVGYAGSGGDESRVLGVFNGRRLVARGPATPTSDVAGAIGQLVATPPALPAADDVRAFLTPGLLPDGAALCLESAFTAPQLRRWCAEEIDVRVWSGSGTEVVQGESVDLGGTPGTLRRDDDGWSVGLEIGGRTAAMVGDHIVVTVTGGLDRDDAIRVASSLPVNLPAEEDLRDGDGDLRAQLSQAWLAEVVADAGASGVEPLPAEGETIGVLATGPAGESVRVLAAPDWPVVTPPFAAEVIALDEVDLVVTLPQSTQAVAGFGCGQISWQLVADDQGPRRFVEGLARAIVADLDC